MYRTFLPFFKASCAATSDFEALIANGIAVPFISDIIDRASPDINDLASSYPWDRIGEGAFPVPVLRNGEGPGLDSDPNPLSASNSFKLENTSLTVLDLPDTVDVFDVFAVVFASLAFRESFSMFPFNVLVLVFLFGFIVFRMTLLLSKSVLEGDEEAPNDHPFPIFIGVGLIGD